MKVPRKAAISRVVWVIEALLEEDFKKRMEAFYHKTLRLALV